MIFKKFVIKGFNAISSFITKPFLKMPNVLSCEETIEYIIKNKVSIGRFGDGELNVMQGLDISFQNADKELAKKLKNVKTDKNFLVAIPSIFNKEFFNKDFLMEDDYNFWKKNLKFTRYAWYKYFKNNKIIGDAFISRFYLRLKDKKDVSYYIQKLKKIWENQDIVIIEGKNSQIGVGNDILNNAKSVKRILCPIKNAFSSYDKILEEVKSKIDKKCLILLALGPTATVLAKDLSDCGFWAVDLGHFDIEYEWFLAKTDKKIPIKTKYVNECGCDGEFNAKNKKYIDEIIEIIE